MRHPSGETITVHPYAGQTRNAHGQVITAWGADRTVEYVAVAPGSTTESTSDGESTVVVQMTIYLPPEVTVSSQDQVTVRGVRYAVDGEKSGEWVNPFNGKRPGSALALKKVTG